jgi:hypothetical protein
MADKVCLKLCNALANILTTVGTGAKNWCRRLNRVWDELVDETQVMQPPQMLQGRKLNRPAAQPACFLSVRLAGLVVARVPAPVHPPPTSAGPGAAPSPHWRRHHQPAPQVPVPPAPRPPAPQAAAPKARGSRTRHNCNGGCRPGTKDIKGVCRLLAGSWPAGQLPAFRFLPARLPALLPALLHALHLPTLVWPTLLLSTMFVIPLRNSRRWRQSMTCG